MTSLPVRSTAGRVSTFAWGPLSLTAVAIAATASFGVVTTEPGDGFGKQLTAWIIAILSGAAVGFALDDKAEGFTSTTPGFQRAVVRRVVGVLAGLAVVQAGAIAIVGSANGARPSSVDETRFVIEGMVVVLAMTALALSLHDRRGPRVLAVWAGVLAGATFIGFAVPAVSPVSSEFIEHGRAPGLAMLPIGIAACLIAIRRASGPPITRRRIKAGLSAAGHSFVHILRSMSVQAWALVGLAVTTSVAARNLDDPGAAFTVTRLGLLVGALATVLAQPADRSLPPMATDARLVAFSRQVVLAMVCVGAALLAYPINRRLVLEALAYSGIAALAAVLAGRHMVTAVGAATAIVLFAWSRIALAIDSVPGAELWEEGMATWQVVSISAWLAIVGYLALTHRIVQLERRAGTCFSSNLGGVIRHIKEV